MKKETSIKFCIVYLVFSSNLLILINPFNNISDFLENHCVHAYTVIRLLAFLFLKLSLDFSNLIQRIMPLSLKPIQFIIQQCNKFLTSNISDVSSSFVLSFVLPFSWIICPLVFAIENWFVLPDPYRFDCLSHRSVSRAFSNNFQSYWWIDVPVGFSDMLVEN